MISFSPTDEEKSFVAVARKLAEEKIRDISRESEERRRVDNELVKEIRDLGFLSLELPESWGGLQLPLISQVQILQALSYGDLGVIQGLPGTGDAASFIRLLEENPLLLSNKQEFANHEKSIAFLNLVDQWGGNITIQNKGNEYVLSGTSTPVRLGSVAEFVIISGVDDTGEHVVLLLDNRPEDTWRVETGDYRLGLLASGLGRFTFDKARIGKSQVLASGKEAAQLIRESRTRIRILQAAKEIGLMEAALDYATEYAAGRKAFGQEIAKFQGVSFRIADMAMESRIASLLVWQAATVADDDIDKAEGVSFRALYRAHRSLRFVTDSAVQLLGGHGYVQEFPVEKWMRDAEAQVGLYGRERDFLLQWGEQIVAKQEEVIMK